jgi:ADP-ribose pyrophosphatase
MEPNDRQLREELISRDHLVHGKFLDFVRDEIADADGGHHVRELVLHPGGVAAVAVRADGNVLFVRQYRHAVGRVLLEIPAGTLDRADDGALEDPARAIARELVEETGYQAADWRPLGSFFTAPGFATEQMFLFLAWRLEPAADYAGPAEDERLELQVMPWHEALAMARGGEIHDAKTLVGLFTVDALLRTGALPELTGVIGEATASRDAPREKRR